MSNESFSYPLDSAWTTDEIVKVTNFYTLVADAYEIGVNREKLLASYREFKEIVPMKFEEKQIDKELVGVSGYSIYKVIKLASSSTSLKIKLDK